MLRFGSVRDILIIVYCYLLTIKYAQLHMPLFLLLIQVTPVLLMDTTVI